MAEAEVGQLASQPLLVYGDYGVLLGLVVQEAASIFGSVVESVLEEKLAVILVVEVSAEKGEEELESENVAVVSLDIVSEERHMSWDFGLASHMASLERRKPLHIGSSCAAERNNEEFAERRREL